MNSRLLFQNSASVRMNTNFAKCKQLLMQPHLDLTMSSMRCLPQLKLHAVNAFSMELSMAAHGSWVTISVTTQSLAQDHMLVYCTGSVTMAMSVAANSYLSMQALKLNLSTQQISLALCQLMESSHQLKEPSICSFMSPN